MMSIDSRNVDENSRLQHPKLTLKISTACGHRMAYRKWKETKVQPGTAGPGNMLGAA